MMSHYAFLCLMCVMSVGAVQYLGNPGDYITVASNSLAAGSSQSVTYNFGRGAAVDKRVALYASSNDALVASYVTCCATTMGSVQYSIPASVLNGRSITTETYYIGVFQKAAVGVAGASAIYRSNFFTIHQ